MSVGFEFQAYQGKGHFLNFYKCRADTKEFLFPRSHYRVGIRLCPHLSLLGLPFGSQVFYSLIRHGFSKVKTSLGEIRGRRYTRCTHFT